MKNLAQPRNREAAKNTARYGDPAVVWVAPNDGAESCAAAIQQWVAARFLKVSMKRLEIVAINKS